MNYEDTMRMFKITGGFGTKNISIYTWEQCFIYEQISSVINQVHCDDVFFT